MKTYKQIIEESMASKLVQTKLGNMERMRSVEIPSHEERRAQMEKRRKDAEEAAAAKAAKKGLKEEDDINEYSLEEMVDYKTMSTTTLNKHLEKHIMNHSRATTPERKLHHLNQIGILKDVIKDKTKSIKEETDINEYSLEELQEFLVSEEFEQLEELEQVALELHINKLQKGEV